MIKVNMYRTCTRVHVYVQYVTHYVRMYVTTVDLLNPKARTLHYHSFYSVFTVHNESMYCMIPAAAAAGTDSTVCMVQACFFASFTIIINDQ